MDYKVILLVVGLCVAFLACIKYVAPRLKCEYDLKSALKSLKELAKIFTNDKVDCVIDDVYAVLVRAIKFAEEHAKNGVVDFDELLDYVISEVEIVGVEVGALEAEILDIACEVICSYIYNRDAE